MTPPELDVDRLIDTLNRHGVEYVVIGGYAAVLHGLARTTEDLDVTPATDDGNLRRLCAALEELGAQLLVPDAAPVPWSWTVEGFRRFTTITTRTSAGDLDICLRPDAPGGHFDYGSLAASAVVITLPPEVPVASLADVIASKAAAGRPKDLASLPELRNLLQSQRQHRHRRDAAEDEGLRR